MYAAKGLAKFAAVAAVTSLAACGSFGPAREPSDNYNNPNIPGNIDNSNTIWNFLNDKPEQTVQVNRYLWNASLDVLNFLPVQSVDPFTGVIVTGYGTPPGGGRSYRATIHISDPALQANALNVALHTKGGPASASATRAVEDAILSRARQLRIADKNL